MTRSLRPSEIKRVEEASGVVTPRSWRSMKTMLGLDTMPDEFWEGKELLDVGSGFKTTDPEKVFPGARISAIDPAFQLATGEFYLQEKDELLQLAGQSSKISEEDHTAHEKKIGVASKIPYPSNKFDLTMSTFTLFNESRFGKAITEMIRVTKPGGQVLLSPIPGQLTQGSFIKQILDDHGFETSTPNGGTSIFVIKIPQENKMDKWKELYRDFDERGIVSKF